MSQMMSSDLYTRLCACLTDILARGPEAHRCAAAKALGAIGDRQALPAVTAALEDEDPDVRCDAAEALGRIGDAAAGPALLRNLQGDPDGDVKLQAVKALGRLGTADAVAPLRRLVRCRDEDMAWDDEAFYQGGWDDWLDIQIAAIEALAAMGEEAAVEDILAALGDEMGQDITAVAVAALAGLGAPGARALAGLLQDPKERVRLNAVTALAGSGSDVAREVLFTALRDPAAQVRLAALRALADVDAGDGRLKVLIADGDPMVRAEAYRLCPLPDGQFLTALLDDPSDLVKRTVLDRFAQAAGALPEDGPAVRLMNRLLAEGAPDVAAAALGALAACCPRLGLAEARARVGAAETPDPVRWVAVKALAGGAEATRTLRGLVGAAHRTVRLEALVALSHKAVAGDELARRTLHDAAAGQMVAAPSEDVDADADAPDPIATAVAEAEQAAEDAAAETPEAAAETASEAGLDTGTNSTLGAILGEESVAREMTEAAEADPNPVRLDQQDLEFLALARRARRRRRVSPETGPAPVHLDVRRFAARLLGDHGDDTAIDTLIAALTADDGELARIAADSLDRIARAKGGLAPAACSALAGLVGRQDRELRLIALRALGAAGGAEAREVLARAARDSDVYVVAAALRALAAIGEPVAGLAPRIDHSAAPVRSAVAEILAESGDVQWIAPLARFTFGHDGAHLGEGVRLLARLDRAAVVAALLEMLDQQHWFLMRDDILRALGDLAGTAAVPA